MKLEQLEQVQSFVNAEAKNPDNIRGVLIGIMLHTGEVKNFHAGSDGDLMVIAELAAQIPKLKMLGILGNGPVPKVPGQ